MIFISQMIDSMMAQKVSGIVCRAHALNTTVLLSMQLGEGQTPSKISSQRLGSWSSPSL